MTSTVVHGWLGNNNSDPVSVSYQVEGDVSGVDANMSGLDVVDVEVQWLSGKINQVFIHCPFEATLRFNHDTSPQDFEVMEGGVFHWDVKCGYPCPAAGDINNLRIFRNNPSEGGGGTVTIRLNKDATS